MTKLNGLTLIAFSFDDWAKAEKVPHTTINSATRLIFLNIGFWACFCSKSKNNYKAIK